MLSVKTNEFAVIDLETTGRSAEVDQILEIGIIIVSPQGNITEHHHTLVRPSKYISKISTNIHGISENMVRHAPTLKMLQTSILGVLDGKILVAHNGQFESRFLTAGFSNLGVDFPEHSFIDTLKISRKHLKLVNNKLPTVAEYYNVPLHNLHNAYYDALATAKVLINMLQDETIPMSAFISGAPFYANDYENAKVEKKLWVSRPDMVTNIAGNNPDQVPSLQ